MLNTTYPATAVQRTAVATSNANDIAQNQSVSFLLGEEIYTVNNAAYLLQQFFSWEINSLRRDITQIYIGLSMLPDNESYINVFLLHMMHDFFNELEENTTIEKVEKTANERPLDDLDYLIKIRERDVQIQKMKIQIQELQTKLNSQK